jgi:hypothetical protein
MDHFAGLDVSVKDSGALSSGACEDFTQSETANAADPSQAAAVKGDRLKAWAMKIARHRGMKKAIVALAHLHYSVEGGFEICHKRL